MLPTTPDVANDVADAMPTGLAAYLRGETRSLTDLECELLVAVGAQAYQNERYDDAVAMFRAYVLARPNSARAWCLLAMSHDAVEDFERAVSLYGIAALAPDQREVANKVAVYQARALCRLDRCDEAADVLDSLEGDLPPDLEALCADIRHAIGGAR